MKTVKFHSLGCKVNQYDTQSIRERFLSRGYQEAENGEPADIYLIDTCTVTVIADRKSRNIIRQCVKENHKAQVIVTGCLVEKDSQVIAGIEGVSLIIGKRFFPQGISDFSAHTRAFLKVQDGCNNFCSYCKVPLARGRSLSRKVDQVIQEANDLAKRGFKEIVLTGICLGAYGKDFTPAVSLLELILRLEEINGLARIRLSSIEPGDISEALINNIAHSKKLCRHLHIPLQSGDNEILKKMNRHYTREDYLRLIQRVKDRIPGIGITTDVLVGFPGETDDNFRNTIEALKQVLPLKAHVFPYSPREGTAAFRFRGKVKDSVVKKRILELQQIVKDCSLTYRKQFINSALEVLIENNQASDKHLWRGFSSNYLKVQARSANNLKNQVVLVKIHSLSGDLALADCLS